jgi:hypothetical protein
MSYRVKIEPMPDNPVDRPGDQSGLWRVVIEDRGTGSIIPTNPPRQIVGENLPYQEALELSSKLSDQLKNE